MAAKGTILKKQITDTILKTFEGSFLYNDGKEIRIPGEEDGVDLQIKVALTCAKENVSTGEDIRLPGEKENELLFKADKEIDQKHIEVSAEEKENVKRLASMLGL